MSEAKNTGSQPALRLRPSDRSSQVGIYLGKQLRFFINESDWKVLPMAAIIAGLVGMVIRNKMFINMEGTLMSAFALTCTAIWNGCFNSIQSVCRERAIIKREHRSGLHISSYVTAHVIYQFLLCVIQTALTMYVLQMLNVKFPEKGFLTGWMTLDIGISMLLITYASDMMSLFISSVARTTTGAMTVMPFILIFQLVFSGGIIPIPEWSKPLSDITISNYGLKAIVSQAGYNNMEMASAWNTLYSMKSQEISGTVTLGELLDMLDSPIVEKRRDKIVLRSYTIGEVSDFLASLSGGETAPAGTGSTAEAKVINQAVMANPDEVFNEPVSLGELADLLKSSEALRQRRDRPFPFKFTLGELFEVVGEDNVRDFVRQKSAAVGQKNEYAQTVSNIALNWLALAGFILLFAFLSMLVLEFIDKDKR